jgi:hypothetical protein
MSRTWTIRRVDVLILLVTVAAVVVRNDREVSEVYNRDWVGAVASRWPPPARSVVGPTLRFGSDLMTALIVTTAGLGLAALRRPFVPSGSRWPERGMAAIAASGLAVGYCTIRVAVDVMADSASGYARLSDPHFLSNSLYFCEGFPRGSILGAWSLLALAGHWEVEADGLERLGRLLGWSWLASMALDLFRSALW